MGMLQGFHGQPLTVADPLGMEWNRDWWALNAGKLHWQPIETFDGDDYDCAVLRAADGRWTYGCRMRGAWCRMTEGATWPLTEFDPIEWAAVTVDDAIMLSQE